MNEELTPRIYREYCWFALVLLILAIRIAGRPPLGETITHAGSGGAPSTPAALAPPPSASPAR